MDDNQLGRMDANVTTLDEWLFEKLGKLSHWIAPEHVTWRDLTVRVSLLMIIAIAVYLMVMDRSDHDSWQNPVGRKHPQRPQVTIGALLQRHEGDEEALSSIHRSSSGVAAESGPTSNNSESISMDEDDETLGSRAGCRTIAKPVRRPDILFVLADDMGWNEVGYHNLSRGLVTPNLDALAAGGVRLHRHYALPVCTPTRAALFTGRYPIRYGLQNGLLYFDTPWCVPSNETFLPSLLREFANYRTALFGKWHLGFMRSSCLPQARGFDEHVGFYQGMSKSYTWHTVFGYFPHTCCVTFTHPAGAYDWVRNGVTDFSAGGVHTVELITRAAVDYLERMASVADPLFLMLSYQSVHSPYQPRKKDLELCSEGELKNDVVCGLLAGLDESVGTVVRAFRRTRGLCNTLIVFSSDNGGQGGQRDTRNYPLRGWKGDSWEGGTRVPAFVWWGWGEPQTSLNEELYHVTDWFPTLLRLANVSIAESRGYPLLDGYDIWDSLSMGTSSPRSDMLYNLKTGVGRGVFNDAAAAYRLGDFKLVIKYIASRGRKRRARGNFREVPMLFNLSDDPSERRDLLKARDKPDPGLVRRMMNKLTQYRSESVEPLVLTPPWQGHSYECAKCPPIRPVRLGEKWVWLPPSDSG